MARELEFILKIGGQLTQQARGSFALASRYFKEIGTSGQNAAGKLRALSTVQARQKKLETSTARLKDAYDRLGKASAARAAYTGQNADKIAALARREEEARAKTAQLLEKTRALAKENLAYKKSVEGLYGPISNLIKDEDKLRRAAELRQKAMAYQQRIDSGRERSALLMMGAESRFRAAAGIARAFRSPVEEAAQAQQMTFELSTVINADEGQKQQALEQARKSAEELAKAGYSTYAEAMTAQYALNSAGLTADLASTAVKTVASVAKITKGELGQVGEVLATAYNNLGSRLDGTTQEKFAALGNILTKVQFKYQIRDFSQLGESMKYAATGITQYNVNLEQSAAAIGMLNSAGLQGGQAGTAFNAMLRGFYKIAATMPGVLKRDASGTIDLTASLAELQRGLVKMDDVSRAQFLSQQFGEEGARAIVPLVSQTAALAEGYKDIGKAVQDNIVDKNVNEYLSLTSTQMAAAREQMMLLGVKIGTVLLPPLTSFLEKGTKIADAVGKFAEANPMLTKLIVGTAAAGAGLNLMASGVMYAGAGFGTLATAARNGGLFINNFRLAMAGGDLAGLRFGKTIGLIMRSFGMLSSAAGFLFSPAGLIIAGVAAAAAAAYMLWKHWDDVKAALAAAWAKLGALWDNFAGKFPTAAKIIKGAMTILLAPFRVWWELFKKIGDLWGKIKGAMSAAPPAAAQSATSGLATVEAVPRAGGGLVSRPELALIGESGPEMVVPLSDRATGLNRLSQAASMLGAGGGGGVTVNYSPSITISGSADKGDVLSALRTGRDELRRMLEELARDNRRVALS